VVFALQGASSSAARQGDMTFWRAGQSSHSRKKCDLTSSLGPYQRVATVGVLLTVGFSPDDESTVNSEYVLTVATGSMSGGPQSF
jgi:hypothetical protein